MRLFVNILALDDKYSLSVKASVWPKQVKYIYLKIKKIFSVFCCSSRIYIKFGILWKKICASEVISFWNYRMQKQGLLQWLKSALSELLSTVNMLNGPKDWLNFCGTIFVRFCDNSERKSTPKICVSVGSEILRQFVNILTPDYKYSLSVKSECLRLPIQMQLPQTKKIFFHFFPTFSESTENLKYFKEKDEPHRRFVSEIINCKKQLYFNT